MHDVRYASGNQYLFGTHRWNPAFPKVSVNSADGRADHTASTPPGFNTLVRLVSPDGEYGGLPCPR